MKIEIIKCLHDNFSYLIVDYENKIASVVDPGEAKPIIKFLTRKNLNLSYIFNTHHHHDHIGGNNELKNIYNAKIVAFADDKNRIPNIDIFLNDRELFVGGSFKANIFHTPGHTSGHICFYFKEEKALFSGDTLFSLGCGRIFEGTYQQMYNSLMLFKSFPKDTNVYFGHEYTLKNSEFCKSYDENNKKLKNKILEIKDKVKNKIPTTPSSIQDELDCNIFLRSNTLENFSKLRDLKDNF